jgi:hypothetical protein
MKSLSLNMTSVEVKAETRALRVNWTRELDSDLNIHYDSALEKLLNREIRKEQRKSIIKKLFLS